MNEKERKEIMDFWKTIAKMLKYESLVTRRIDERRELEKMTIKPGKL